MKVALIEVLKVLLNIIYAPMKLFKTKNQIVYLSRQRNEKGVDINLLEKALKEENPNVKQVFRLKMLDDGFINKIKYGFYILGDMYYLATSRVAVLDTYSVTVSCLKHKKSLKVVQMWHALGAIKKFGLQAVGTKEGRDEKLSKAMCMHKNYDYVLAPSSETARIYMEAFGVDNSKIKLCPMPRVDFITDSNSRATEFYSLNPGLGDKKIVLYVPTFRDREAVVAEKLKAEFKELDGYKLIISNHPLSKVKKDKEFIPNGSFTSFELMKIADIIITDYSACAFEASLLLKPLYFFVPDFDEYMKDRGINVDIREELASATFYEADELVNAIVNKEYDFNSLYSFRNKYVDSTKESNSKILAKFLLMLMGD